jgi:hypothetical protein
MRKEGESWAEWVEKEEQKKRGKEEREQAREQACEQARRQACGQVERQEEMYIDEYEFNDDY